MQAYDEQDYSPAAPVADIVLRNPQNGASASNVRLMLDTGSDITLLPRRVVEGLRVEELPESYEMRGFDGTISCAPTVWLDLIFLAYVFRGRYVLIEKEHGIMGRDVLNHLALLFDGPKQKWSEDFPDIPF